MIQLHLRALAALFPAVWLVAGGRGILRPTDEKRVLGDGTVTGKHPGQLGAPVTHSIAAFTRQWHPMGEPLSRTTVTGSIDESSQ